MGQITKFQSRQAASCLTALTTQIDYIIPTECKTTEIQVQCNNTTSGSAVAEVPLPWEMLC